MLISNVQYLATSINCKKSSSVELLKWQLNYSLQLYDIISYTAKLNEYYGIEFKWNAV